MSTCKKHITRFYILCVLVLTLPVLLNVLLTACGCSSIPDYGEFVEETPYQDAEDYLPTFPRLEGVAPFEAFPVAPRYFGEPKMEFIPGNHGALLPFKGGRIRLQYAWGFHYIYTFGFINDRGEVIVDALESSLIGNGLYITIPPEKRFLSWFYGDYMIFSYTDEYERPVVRLENIRTNEIKWELFGYLFRLPIREMNRSSYGWLGYFSRMGTEGIMVKNGVLSKNGSIIIDFVFDRLTPIGVNFFALQGRFGGLLGPDGEWIFRTHIQKASSI